MLGLSWTAEDLKQFAASARAEAGVATPDDVQYLEAAPNSTVRIPLAFLVRPEIIEMLQKRAAPELGGKDGMSHVDADSISLSTVSKEQFLERLGQRVADPWLSSKGKDQFDPAHESRVKSGFGEGRSRRLGDRR